MAYKPGTKGYTWKNRQIDDGTYHAYVVIDVGLPSHETKTIGFKTRGTIQGFVDSYMRHSEIIVNEVLKFVFTEKMRNMNTRRYGTRITLKEIERLNKYRLALLKLYNDLAIKTEQVRLEIDAVEDETIAETLERLLNKYLDEV